MHQNEITQNLGEKFIGGHFSFVTNQNFSKISAEADWNRNFSDPPLSTHRGYTPMSMRHSEERESILSLKMKQ